MSRLSIFCLPGLGLSTRIFDQLAIEFGELIMLDWIEPKGWESIKEYAFRLSEPLLDAEGEIVLIGHSFGGVLAQEISRLRPVKQIILISSMMRHHEIPVRLKLLGQYGLHRLITRQIILLTFPFWARTHSYRTPELRQVFRASVRSLSSHYFRWALYHISTWKDIDLLEIPVFRIHGDKDVTFEIQKIQHVDHLVKGGDHNMVYLKGKEILEVINQLLVKV
ncbi:MAG: alpha/beta hydrolase [Cytophagales bacterium]|nr:alpha/beta hydrolase [Cytophagales bacterium]